MTFNPLPPVYCAADYEALAAQVLGAATFAYVQGGSGLDWTTQRNRQLLEQQALVTRLLNAPQPPDLRVRLFGQTFDHPLMLAPVAHQKLMHPSAELETAKGAAAMNACMVSSTLSSFTLEEIANSTSGTKWFQLYPQATWEDTERLVQRAQRAGYRALVLTADAHIQLPSRRALQSGFQWPDHCTAANLPCVQQSPPLPVDVDFLQKVLGCSGLPVILKGVLDPRDARLAKSLGVSGVVVSNHGGRTIDGVCASVEALPAIRRALGPDYPVLMDGGIYSGQSVFKALALGANAVLLGRLPMYGLAVAGALGVGHVLKLLLEELSITLQACGCDSIAQIAAYSQAGEADAADH